MEVNEFYSISHHIEGKKEFDLFDLGERFTLYTISFIGGNSSNPVIGTRKTEAKDYDDEFIKELLKLSPAYKTKDFLDYHFDFYRSMGKQPCNFLEHVKFVILPNLRNKATRPEFIEITADWLNKKENMDLKKHLQEKQDFLRKAYEAALEYHPSGPLSVNIKPIELGEAMGFDKATVRRIVQELSGEGYALATAGLGGLFVTQDGLNYLRRLENREEKKETVMHIQSGNNSPIQIQNGTTYSQQTISVKDYSHEDILKTIEEIRAGINELAKNLSPEKIEELIDSITYLEKDIKRNVPDKSLFNKIVERVFKILQEVPAQVISVIITSQMNLH